MRETTANLDLDLDRLRRCGFPEVVFGMGKTVDEIVRAATGIHAANGMVLVTRAAPEALHALREALPQGEAHPRCGAFAVAPPEPTHGPVAVVSAGSSDAPVAEEAALTLRMRGVEVVRFADCGVAGLHRLLRHVDEIRRCVCAVAVAGMDAAMGTVLGGLVDIPVIAVPTSVGYGVVDGGRTALHSLLASCAAGVTVVNIDNGFGAGYAAATVARMVGKRV